MIHDALNQLLRIMQAPVWKVPKFRLAIAKHFRCRPRFIRPHTCIAEAGTVGQNDHVNRNASTYVAGNCATTAEDFVVRVRCQHQGRFGGQSGYCCVGDKVGFQWGLHRTELMILGDQVSEV